jgi:Eco57I restriction-modification methylase/TaqI-like C-terminal specificity domain
LAQGVSAQTINSLLRELRGLEPLKKLFWTELNYNQVNKPLPRTGWAEAAAQALAEDPVLFAAGGQDEAFHVIYARLASDRLLFGQERPVVSRLLRDHPYALFVFSTEAHDRWHFLNVQYDEDAEKRRLFRRITVGPEERRYERLRTATERLQRLDLAGRELSPIELQAAVDDAFKVEPVTDEFFKEYARVFEEVERHIRGIRDQERKRLFTQRLFNRLMFIAFIQRKGWLKFGNDTDYLNALWEDYQHHPLSKPNFYSDRLKLLFFHGLNTASEIDLIGINRNRRTFLKDLMGDVPYLNGGLFEEDDDDRDQDIVVPDESISAIRRQLFNRFNFTVTESTPLDVEVAVDPEMLGKVFEELVTGRHETGSYYTPKPVVAFMCREALKGYLKSAAPREAPAAVERFVDEHDPSGLRDPEAVLDALKRVKVCDPACGSGAYLLGMMHELLALRACLFATDKRLDALSAYQRKLEIIQSNVYGVDIDPFAVNIARLRLWLSLAVDFEGDNPPPLPNLDFKIEAGDSLTAPDPSGELEQGFRKALVEEFLGKKAEFLMAHGSRKVTLKKEIRELKETITGWAHGKGAVDGFDWPVEFAEVFLNGGFDVVLTNPPYVRMELFKGIKPVLRRNFPTVHAERADLYCYFYARALELLRHGGMQVFISSNKWLRANYGAGLRQQLAERCRVFSITDFGDLPVFKATAYPMIFVAQKLGAGGGAALHEAAAFTRVKSLEAPYPDVLAVIRQQGQALPKDAVRGKIWRLTATDSSERLRKMEARGTPLAEYVGGQIWYGVKTGLNAAFVIDGKTRRRLIGGSPNAKEAIKPLAMGRDIRKWRLADNDRWLIYTYHGIDTKGLSAILDHLRPYRRQLEARATKQEWYELQQPQLAYAPAFAKPKIMYPIISKSSPFAFDRMGAFTNDKGFIIPVGDLYLLGVLNSSAVWSAIEAMCSPLRGGFYELRFVYMSKIPVPDASPAERTVISKLVQNCLDAEGAGCETWEKEINERVAALYGL